MNTIYQIYLKSTNRFPKIHFTVHTNYPKLVASFRIMAENENPFIKYFLKSPTEQMNYLFQIMKVLKCSILTLINNLGKLRFWLYS